MNVDVLETMKDREFEKIVNMNADIRKLWKIEKWDANTVKKYRIRISDFDSVALSAAQAVALYAVQVNYANITPLKRPQTKKVFHAHSNAHNA